MMATESSEQKQDVLFLKSALYQNFEAEREEILRHKWIESEKSGHDMGFEKALLDWTVHHRANWLAQRQKELTQSDPVLIPESTLQSFLGVSGTDLSLETSRLAHENGWTATRTPDGHWLFERKGS
jgi:hypothetical protein